MIKKATGRTPRPRISRIGRTFYSRPTLKVAHDCIGKYIVYDSPAGRLSSRIVEVEAYITEKDPACHAAVGRNQRNQQLWEKPGIAYIYKIYGYYFCLNFVTERESLPAAVLLRAAEPVEGLDIMRANTPTPLPDSLLLSGPGRFCRAYDLDLKQNGWDMAQRASLLYLEDHHEAAPEIATSPRIGITKAVEWPWRFYDSTSPSVSGPAHMRGKRITLRSR